MINLLDSLNHRGRNGFRNRSGRRASACWRRMTCRHSGGNGSIPCSGLCFLPCR